MTVSQAVTRLLAYFAPEERAIPDAARYPGRNAAALGALNAAFEELAGDGPSWPRSRTKTCQLQAPETVDLTISSGATTATMPSEDWQSWMEGCTIAIDGATADNEILSATGTGTKTLKLLRAHDGTASVVGTGNKMVITGTLNPDATGTLLHAGEYSGHSMWSSDGTQMPPETGEWVALAWDVAFGTECWFIISISDNWANGVWSSEEPAPDDPEDATFTGIPFFDIEAPTGTPTVTHTVETTTTVSATVLHDSVALATDVLGVLKPVTIVDGPSLVQVPSPAHMHGVSLNDDYDRKRIDRYQSVLFERRSENLGVPVVYYVDTWTPASGDPTFRLRVAPAPLDATWIDWREKVRPPAFTTVNATVIPLAHNLVESVLLPVAIQRLSASPFFRAEDTSRQEIARQYQMARKLLRQTHPATPPARIRPAY
jgi:hypothetical protein